MVSVTKKENIVRVVQAWQEGLKKIGQNRGAEFVERWKQAPLLLFFCQPRNFEPFQFVPPEHVRMFSVQEVGTAVRSIELVALTHGIGLHGIMGVLVPEIGERVKTVLTIPADYATVYLGVMGYPGEEVVQKFPRLEEICYEGSWGNPSRL